MQHLKAIVDMPLNCLHRMEVEKTAIPRVTWQSTLKIDFSLINMFHNEVDSAAVDEK